jgi:hypothetical protein
MKTILTLLLFLFSINSMASMLPEASKAKLKTLAKARCLKLQPKTKFKNGRLKSVTLKVILKKSKQKFKCKVTFEDETIKSIKTKSNKQKKYNIASWKSGTALKGNNQKEKAKNACLSYASGYERNKIMIDNYKYKVTLKNSESKKINCKVKFSSNFEIEEVKAKYPDDKKYKSIGK